mmetsp:Transcript_98119/g.194276  ORF Transcript_98119/g.194276 Transcript_98119/m.194276 type:complete len:88 (-) Transcript_98119:44-307(-)
MCPWTVTLWQLMRHFYATAGRAPWVRAMLRQRHRTAHQLLDYLGDGLEAPGACGVGKEVRFTNVHSWINEHGHLKIGSTGNAQNDCV